MLQAIDAMQAEDGTVLEIRLLLLGVTIRSEDHLIATPGATHGVPSRVRAVGAPTRRPSVNQTLPLLHRNPNLKRCRPAEGSALAQPPGCVDPLDDVTATLVHRAFAKTLNRMRRA